MEVYLNEKLVNVKIIRRNNKNIYFRFDKDLNLVVSANKLVRLKDIESLINKNSDSLAKMYDKCLKARLKEQEFWYLGNKYNVIYDGDKDIEFAGDNIICKDEDTLNKFIKKQTIQIFREEADKLKSIIKTPNFTLKIRKMKTRWGVCNYKNNIITLNYALIKYRKELLRYVIVHEMCHFYYHNHGKEFWNMVSEYYPNYKEARKELNNQ